MGGLQIGEKVERVDGRKLRYEEFVERYLKGNRPVVLMGLMDAWRACSDWVTPDGRPNLPFFAHRFGKSLVQVADCCTRDFTDQKRLEMSVADFISHWLGLSVEKCTNDLNGSEKMGSLLYLKDWHFVKEYPDYVAYTTPAFFNDDWLNLYLDSHYIHRDSDIHHDKNEINCADYRFVYMGAKGTWTPLHADVFRSYSWSANVCGKKQWLFLPPSQRHLVFDRHLKYSVYNVYDDVSETQFPGFKKTIWWECIQEQNEIIFVPSGWYHQVHNLEDTISINHNWFNAYNLSWVWNLLVEDYNVAKEYIEDIRDICDEFESICQRNLAANTGMNFCDFFILITRFALANMIQLYQLRNEEDALSSSSNKAHHFISNLVSIRAVASKMKSFEAFTGEYLNSCSVENHSAFSDVKQILEEKDFHELCVALVRAYETTDGLWEQKFEIGKAPLCPRDSLLLNCSRADCGIQNFVTASSSQISGPEDLIRLIEHAVINSRSTSGNFDLMSEWCEP
ncbi:2-oxoglutarate and iron-dependent oxygenase JMJD4 [Cocos nucifera]|uniref:2-oxoglutarate and iron-dependent oxygenase JMJD4 n=1 Tax=Cocos nucifera TaxID=13894 RepID=A0A8K0N2X3_COCNU|nr:2-oxoglutarate and iron-dependent oxygenase JMJD4 [Cocos nucifera]